jgi:hypothetical protein|tara:strand:- start:64 stop:399 length:336 start_codon:yes stop_codon:yes gene_type:complete
MNDVDTLTAALLNKSHKKELAMTVIIRRLEHSDHEYFAYVKSLGGKATYFLYFSDDIAGAMVLHNFVEMLRRYFQKDQIEVKLHDTTIQLKNACLLSIFSEPQSTEKSTAC